MAKQLWIGLAAALSLVAGIAVYLASGQGWIAGTAGRPDAALVVAATAALLAGFFLVFATLAIVDWLEARRVEAALDRLLAATAEGAVIEPGELLDALSASELHAMAVPYAASLRHDVAGVDPRRYVGGRPADYLGLAAQVDDRLHASVFRRFPVILGVLGAIALLLGLRDGLLAYSADGAWTALATSAHGAMLACAVPLIAALLVMLVLPTVLSVRRRQAEAVLHRIDALFPGGDEGFYLRRLIDNTQSNAVEIKVGFRTALDEIRETLRLRAETQADAMREAVAAALQGPMSALACAVERSQARQDEAVSRLVSEALSQFTTALGGAIGDQMERLQDTLASAQDAAASLQQGFAATMQAAGERQDRQERVLSGELERHLDGVAEQLRAIGDALAIQMERHASAVGAQADHLHAGLARLGETLVAQTAAELRSTVAAVRQLYSTVDSLCLSVAPVLNRLVDTQDDLAASLSSESHNARIFAELAADLKQLSRGNRETVEKHIALASELARATQHLAGGGMGRGAGANGASEGVLRALRELRSETDAATRPPLPRAV